MLRASHYHLLTQDEWRIALSESFQLTLPLEVEWDYMDTGMTKRFWGAPDKKELRARLPDTVGAGGGFGRLHLGGPMWARV